MWVLIAYVLVTGPLGPHQEIERFEFAADCFKAASYLIGTAQGVEKNFGFACVTKI